MRYIDFAYGRPGAQNILNDGFGGVVRYLSKTVKKNLDMAEFLDYKSHNVLVHVVYEDGAADHNGGRAAGEANSQRAKDQLKSFGWTGQGCIYFVPYDANETSASLPLTLEYFRGINQNLSVKNVGIYGDADALNAVRQVGLATYFWQSGSKSFGPDVECNMRQIAAQHTINGVNVDINNVFTTDTGAITGEAHSVTSSQDDLRVVLNEANATGFNSFAEMFKIDTPQSKGIVALLRYLYNNSATTPQVGLINANINSLYSLHDEIAELKALVLANQQETTVELDYAKLAQALIAALQNPSV
jgi:hypothetical protein